MAKEGILNNHSFNFYIDRLSTIHDSNEHVFLSEHSDFNCISHSNRTREVQVIEPYVEEWLGNEQRATPACD